MEAWTHMPASPRHLQTLENNKETFTKRVIFWTHWALAIWWNLSKEGGRWGWVNGDKGLRGAGGRSSGTLGEIRFLV